MGRLWLEEGLEFSLQAEPGGFCVGSFQDGVHRSCPENQEVNRFRQCQACASDFIPKQECLFEPKCDGSLCDAAFCKREHLVYLALFKDDVKVGMTGKDRLLRRGVEQGADAMATLATTRTREDARNLEKRICAATRLSQFYTFNKFLQNLSNQVSKSSMEKVCNYYSRRISSRFGFKPGELQFLESYPMPSSINARVYPRKWEEGCNGKFVGAKGKCLVFRKEGYRAADLSKLTTRVVAGWFRLDREHEGQGGKGA